MMAEIGNKNDRSDSFNDIFAAYRPLVVSMANEALTSHSLPASDCDDLIQEASIALYNAASTYIEGKNVSFGLYAKICIKHRLTSYIHCHYGRYSGIDSISIDALDTEESECSVEEIISDKESLESLRKRINSMLTETEQAVLWLYLSDMSYNDISKALSKSTKSVDNAIRRIKTKLRKLL